MKQEYDFSRAERGKFFREGAELQLPTADRSPQTGFIPGQLVCLASDPSVKGAVVEVVPGTPEDRIKVFVGSNVQTYYASQLQADDQDNAVSHLTSEQFHAYLTALQIRHPGLSTLYSLNAARVDFIPYQFRPVLKFIRSDRPRLLIADGVGVGKTIEAGLILRELQARREIQSVLVVCPRPLVTERKWEREMRRFDQRFTHLDGPTLRYCISEMDLDGEWPDRHQKAILPYSLFDEALLHGPENSRKRRRGKGLLDLDPPPRFDLVIVDEAHRIRNQHTFAHKAVRFFCDHAEAVVFLTATPIQLGNHDLFVLLNTLRPDLILDEETFEHIAAPNPFINEAVHHVRAQAPGWTGQATQALDKAAATAWGQTMLRANPEFNRIKEQLAEGCVPAGDRVQLITDTEALHTFSGIVNRTRRRDIGAFTVRKPETVMVPFTAPQQQLHDELLQVQADIFRRLHDDINVKFLLTTIRRQAASCLYGLVPFLESILNRHLDELEWEEADDMGPVPSGEAIDSIQGRIEAVLEQARSLDPHDPKLEALRNMIREKQRLSNNKVMLFSSFRHTLAYLYEHLKTDGFRVGMVHGGTPDEDRIGLRSRFEQPQEAADTLDVLLFSEIGCEGLDYQFCDCIVNYDLPWNPMRVEQRIGRIDRVGQKSETVAIVNMITPETVDADIYERCLVRIGVFEKALGGSEEILGEISKEIKKIAENYALGEEDRRARLQQLADNKIRLVQEQEKLEKQQLELFGLRLPEDQMKKEVEDASSFWLTPVSIQRLVANYLNGTCGEDREFILGEKALKTLRLSQEARTTLFRDFQELAGKNAPEYRAWERWLKGGDPHLSMTLEGDCARQHPDAAFITPLHPLVKQAAMSLKTDRRVFTVLKAQSNEAPAGRYEFAVYQWQFHGIREDLLLKPIASSEAVTPHLGKLLESALETSSADPVDSATALWDALDEQHYTVWSEAKEEHRQRTRELVAYRRESLSKSHQARMAILAEQLAQASDEKLQRMRRSQIAAAEADYTRRIEELKTAMGKTDIIAEPVAYGIIELQERGRNAE